MPVKFYDSMEEMDADIAAMAQGADTGLDNMDGLSPARGEGVSPAVPSRVRSTEMPAGSWQLNIPQDVLPIEGDVLPGPSELDIAKLQAPTPAPVVRRAPAARPTARPAQPTRPQRPKLSVLNQPPTPPGPVQQFSGYRPLVDPLAQRRGFNATPGARISAQQFSTPRPRRPQVDVISPATPYSRRVMQKAEAIEGSNLERARTSAKAATLSMGGGTVNMAADLGNYLSILPAPMTGGVGLINEASKLITGKSLPDAYHALGDWLSGMGEEEAAALASALVPANESPVQYLGRKGAEVGGGLVPILALGATGAGPASIFALAEMANARARGVKNPGKLALQAAKGAYYGKVFSAAGTIPGAGKRLAAQAAIGAGQGAVDPALANLIERPETVPGAMEAATQTLQKGAGLFPTTARAGALVAPPIVGLGLISPDKYRSIGVDTKLSRDTTPINLEAVGENAVVNVVLDAVMPGHRARPELRRMVPLDVLQTALPKLNDIQLRDALTADGVTIPPDANRKQLMDIAAQQFRNIIPTAPTRGTAATIGQPTGEIPFIADVIRGMKVEDLRNTLDDAGITYPISTPRAALERMLIQHEQAMMARGMQEPGYTDPASVQQARAQGKFPTPPGPTQPPFAPPSFQVPRERPQRPQLSAIEMPPSPYGEAEDVVKVGKRGRRVSPSVPAGLDVEAGFEYPIEGPDAEPTNIYSNRPRGLAQEGLRDVYDPNSPTLNAPRPFEGMQPSQLHANPIFAPDAWRNYGRSVIDFLRQRQSRTNDPARLFTRRATGRSDAENAGLTPGMIQASGVNDYLRQNPNASINDVISHIERNAPRFSATARSIQDDLSLGPRSNRREITTIWDNAQGGSQPAFTSRMEDRNTIEGDSVTLLDNITMLDAGAQLREGGMEAALDSILADAARSGKDGVLFPTEPGTVDQLAQLAEQRTGRRLEIRTIDLGDGVRAELQFIPTQPPPEAQARMRPVQPSAASIPTVPGDRLARLQAAAQQAPRITEAERPGASQLQPLQSLQPSAITGTENVVGLRAAAEKTPTSLIEERSPSAIPEPPAQTTEEFLARLRTMKPVEEGGFRTYGNPIFDPDAWQRFLQGFKPAAEGETVRYEEPREGDETRAGVPRGWSTAGGIIPEGQEPTMPAIGPDKRPKITNFETPGGANVTLEEYPNAIKVAGINVPPSGRNQGEGGRTMQQILDRAAQEGKPVFLTAHAQSPEEQPALNRFYERLGFKEYNKDPLSGKPMYRWNPPGYGTGAGGGTQLSANPLFDPSSYKRYLSSKPGQVGRGISEGALEPGGEVASPDVQAEGDYLREHYGVPIRDLNREITDAKQQTLNWEEATQIIDDSVAAATARFEQVMKDYETAKSARTAARNKLNALKTLRDQQEYLDPAKRAQLDAEIHAAELERQRTLVEATAQYQRYKPKAAERKIAQLTAEQQAANAPMIEKAQQRLAQPDTSYRLDPTTPWVEEILNLPIGRSFYHAALDAAVASNYVLNPDIPVTRQMLDIADRIPVTQFTDILERHGYDLPKLYADIDKSASIAGKFLNLPSQIARELNKMVRRNPELAELANQIMANRLPNIRQLNSLFRQRSNWDRATTMFQGMLIGAVETAQKNLITAGMMVHMDTLGQLLDSAAQGTANAFHGPVGGNTQVLSPVLAIRPLLNFYGGVYGMLTGKGVIREKSNVTKMVEQLAEAFPKEAGRPLFEILNSDIETVEAQGGDVLKKYREQAESLPDGSARKQKLLDAITAAEQRFSQSQTKLTRTFIAGEKVVHTLGWANYAQERVARRAIFEAKVRRFATEAGFDISDMAANGKLGELPPEIISRATQETLRQTFGLRPEPGSRGDHLARVLTGPLGFAFKVGGFPFPNFWIHNFLRFQYEHSPAGLLSLMSKDSVAQLAFKKGDYSAIWKALIGVGVYGMALQAAHDKYEQMGSTDIPGEESLLQKIPRKAAGWAVPVKRGEKWYEFNMGGRNLDARFLPFAPHLFMADFTERARRGLSNYTAEDVVNALGANTRSVENFGSLVDDAVKSFRDYSAKEAFSRSGGEYFGAIAAGILTPLKTYVDLPAQFFSENERKARDTKTDAEGWAAFTDSFKNQLKQRVPWWRESLPERELPTRKATPMAQAPATKLLSGLTLVEPRNFLEAESVVLGLTQSQIVPHTGNARVDRLIDQKMGEYLEGVGEALHNNQYYNSLPAEQRRQALIDRILPAYWSTVKDYAYAHAPDERAKKDVMDMFTKEELAVRNRRRRAEGKPPLESEAKERVRAVVGTSPGASPTP